MTYDDESCWNTLPHTPFYHPSEAALSAEHHRTGFLAIRYLPEQSEVKTFARILSITKTGVEGTPATKAK